MNLDSPAHPLRLFRYCPACGSARFREHDFKSKRCDDCGFTYYHNASAATVAVVIDGAQRLLVARQNDFDFILFVKLIADINGAGSRITEEILDTLLLQSLYQKFVSCNLFHMKTSCSKFAA